MKYLRDTQYCGLSADQKKNCHKSVCNCDMCEFHIFEIHISICMMAESGNTILGSKLNV